MKLKKFISILLLMSLIISYIIPLTVSAKENDTNKESYVFYDDFSGDSLDTSKWLIAKKAWGKNNGGVVPENVSVSDGILKLEGHGDYYTGDVAGIKREDGKRTGAAIATRDYFGSGSYEVLAKVAPELGACSAIWTFEYEEYYPGDEKYEELGASGSYYVVNHEIDIEMPGRASSGATPSYEYALCNTWIGEKNKEHTTNYTKLPYAQNDGNFHKYRFDWHTGDEGEEPRVEFYFDDELITTNYQHIPTNKGRLWIGLWFPNEWAGTPNFDTSVFEIDYVKITPFYEAGDKEQNETYGKDGWAEDSFKEDTKRERVTFDKSIGACGFIDDPIESVLSGLGTIREYHNYRWITEKPNQCRFTQGTWWDWDSYYKKLHDLGVDVVPCIQGTSQADRSGYNGNKQQKPINPGEDSLDPESYKEHAQTMFQYAARYGNVEVDDSKLLLEDGQKRLSGLGYIEYYENWNEPDKSWEGEEAHFTGAEYAAMCSADYDGHEGRLGNTYGIKNADPNAKLVMGGIAGGRWTVEYLEEMKRWAEQNRTDKQIPIDVINFHMYSGKNYPEKYEYIENFEKIVAWRNENAPDKEIWLTEFGWDTNTGSENGATYEQQRDWLMRTYLIANAHGIDRSTMYMTRDTSSASSTGKYSTSGLTTQKGEQAKKTSWYGVATLKNTLTGFDIDEIEENESVYKYKFINKKTNEVCYVLWSPTGDGTKIDNYELNIGSNKQATLTEFVDNSTEGKITNLETRNGTVAVSVTETPIFIKLNDSNVDEKIPLSFSVSLNSDKTEVHKGDNIIVKASIDTIEKNSSNGLIALSGKLEYNTDILEIDLNSLAGLENWNFSKNDYNLENFKLVTDNEDFVEEAGDIFQITFKVKEDAVIGETTIKLTSVNGATGQLENGLIYANDAELSLEIQEKQSFALGDIDRDLEITVNDLARLKLHLIEEELLQGESLELADLDQDGDITINDLAKLKLILIEK